MITVRFPNGQAVTYNSAALLTYKPGSAWELTSKNGGWVASIQESAGVIVESEPPCKVENPIMAHKTNTVTLTTAQYQRLLRRARG